MWSTYAGSQVVRAWLESDFFFSHPGGVCVCFLFSTADTTEPGVHAGHYEDDLLSPLPRHAIGQTVRQLLHQRHEGLSGQPGRPQHRMEASGRWAARARCTQFGHMFAPRSLPCARFRRTHRIALLPVFNEGKRLHSRALLCLFL